MPQQGEVNGDANFSRQCMTKKCNIIVGRTQHQNHQSKVLGMQYCLLVSYLRSLVTNFYIPMRAACLQQAKDIELIVAREYRKMHIIARDIQISTLLNLTQSMELVANVLKERQVISGFAAYRDTALSVGKYTKAEGRSFKMEKSSLAKEITAKMLEITRGWTIVYFGKRHKFNKNGCIIDDEHLRKSNNCVTYRRNTQGRNSL